PGAIGRGRVRVRRGSRPAAGAPGAAAAAPPAARACGMAGGVEARSGNQRSARLFHLARFTAAGRRSRRREDAHRALPRVRGADADLVIWDPDAEFVVDERRLHQRHKRTPYEGMTLRGRIKETYARGRLVYRDGQPQ